MKYIKLFFAITLAFSVCSCGSNKNSTSDTTNVESRVESSDSTINTQSDSDLIKTVYEKLVLGLDHSEKYSLDHYFTANALKKLRDHFVYDVDDIDQCYALYELRTGAQDSKPGTDEKSSIISIESVGDGWYLVKYLDMGWTGMTRIKVVDGKIDDYNEYYYDETDIYN